MEHLVPNINYTWCWCPKNKTGGSDTTVHLDSHTLDCSAGGLVLTPTIRDIFHDPRSTFLIFKTESIRAQWQDVGGLAAACCSASPSGAHSPPWGREPTGECCLRDSPAARPYPGTASAQPARSATPSAGPAALPAGGQ